MELYVPLPRHVFFLLLTACCFSLIRCSLCLDAQYQYCQHNSKCGIMNITYPFGVGKRGCGHPGFQINCVQNSSPVIEIHGRTYTILRILSPYIFFIVRGENCNFFGRPNNNLQIPSSEYGDALFRISGKENRTLDVYKCNMPFHDGFDSTGEHLWKCNATVYYDFFNSGHSIRGFFIEQVVVEIGITNWVSNDTERDKGCKSCEASGGICGYNIGDSTWTFLCYCKDGPRTHKCPGHGMLYFNFLQNY